MRNQQENKNLEKKRLGFFHVSPPEDGDYG